MLVTQILGDCPVCRGKDQFGNVSVQGDHVLRGCMACNYVTTIRLPEIRKKILYLDQFFFSTAFKDGDSRFIEAAQRIRKIAALQILAVPFSSIHENETYQWRGYNQKNKEELMDFIKKTSRGHKFEPTYSVEQTQIIRAFQAYLKANTTTFELHTQDAIPSNIHKWDDYFRIDLISRFGKDIELIRELKIQSVEMLVEIFPVWRQSTLTYAQDVTLELKEGAKSYIDAYFKYVTLIGTGDYNALKDSPIISKVVASLFNYFPNDSSLDEKQKLNKIIAFFNSEHFSEIPYQFLSARIFATLKDMVKRNSYLNREKSLKKLSGFFL